MAYRCDICRQKLPSLDAVERHKNVSRHNDFTDVRDLVQPESGNPHCDQCTLVFQNFRDLAKHKRRVHSPDEVSYQIWVCNDCGATFLPTVENPQEPSTASNLHTARSGHTGRLVKVHAEFGREEYDPERMDPPVGALIETGDACTVYVVEEDPFVKGWRMQNGKVYPASTYEGRLLNRIWKEQGRNYVAVGSQKPELDEAGNVLYPVDISTMAQHQNNIWHQPDPPIGVAKRGDQWLSSDGVISQMDVDGTWKPIGTLRGAPTR